MSIKIPHICPCCGMQLKKVHQTIECVYRHGVKAFKRPRYMCPKCKHTVKIERLFLPTPTKKGHRR